ncbi:MAG: fibronectin type III domain-containing protein, partial [Acidobacteriaceae bacterium]|nr:fibronectin type III domain-containing protein [Acidobacteriaceae bacterium]
SNQIAGPLSAGSYADSTGLAASTTYYYVVEAVNSIGSTPSAEVSALTLTPPDQPTGLTATALSGSQIYLTWNQVAGVTYKVYRGADNTVSSSTGTLVTSTSAATYIDSGLAANTDYYYVVVAVNSSGSSPDSASATATTTDATSSVPPASGPGAAMTGYADAASLGVPQYVCVNDYYVDAQSGSDSGDGSSGAPWANLGSLPALVAGDCVDLNGTFSITGQLALSQGGNTNSPTGYVVYRATTPGGATIQQAAMAGSENLDFVVAMADYLILDGLTIDGADNGYMNCISDQSVAYHHHLVVENSVMKHCGASGIMWAGSDYTWAVNNLIEDNGAVNVLGTYGSNGIGNNAGVLIVEPLVPGSGGGPNAYDTSFTPNTADQAFPYHNVVAFNIIQNNTQVGQLSYPGSPVITAGVYLDDGEHTMGWPGGPAYTDPMAVIGNVIYNNSGQAVALWHVGNVTVANNSTYGNNTQPLAAADGVTAWGPGTGTASRGEITCDPCSDSTFINNATVAVVGSGDETANNSSYFFSGTSTGNTLTTNIGSPSFGTSAAADGTTGVDPETTGTATGNLIGTDPQFNAASTGDFSLQSGSAASGSGTAAPWLTASPVNMGQVQ